MDFVTEQSSTAETVETDPQLAETRNAIPGVASAKFHRVLLFSGRLSRVPNVILAIYVGCFTLTVLLVWAGITNSLPSGFGVSAIYLVFVILDWIMLAQLPRRGRSFGPVAPPLMMLTLMRALLTIIPVLLPLGPLWVITLVEISNLALTGYALDGLWGEPFRLTLTRLTIKSPRLRGAPPLRLVHLSDFHIERMTKREAKLLNWLNELLPDIIVYTGDLLNYSFLDDERARAECVSLLGQLHAPLGVYAIPGTPLIDRPDILDAVYSQVPHIHLLRNETIELEAYPQLQIMGLTCTHDPHLDGPKLVQARAAIPAHKFTLLLYHAPDLMPQAVEAQIDLYLCGHTHGGQVRLPLFGALVTSSLYGKRYEMGWYVEGNTTLYVNRGIGMEGKGVPRLRFLCSPEIVVLELRGDVP